MPISNYLPSSRLIQPGVCTSSTRPASPYNGQVIYETDTNKTYVYNGSAWIMQIAADTPPGLELVKAQAVGSGVASVTVTDCFSSTYATYLIQFAGIKAGAQVGLSLQLSGITSGYDYQGFYMLKGSSTLTGFNTSNGSGWDCGATDTSTSIHEITIVNPNVAAGKAFMARASGAGGTNIGVQTWGQNTSTSTATGFVITPASSTLTGGTIRVYGYRNSI